MSMLLSISLSIIITVLGAVPFGLVNLTVIDIAYRSNTRKAMQVAIGATGIEIIFGLIAVYLGAFIQYYIDTNNIIRYTFLIIPGIVGFVFIFKKNSNKIKTYSDNQGFYTGAFLNIISIQVLMFWIIAISYLNTLIPLQFDIKNIVFFIIGIAIGKIGILGLYAHFSERILSRFQFLANNINKLIGVILLCTVILQAIRI